MKSVSSMMKRFLFTRQNAHKALLVFASCVSTLSVAQSQRLTGGITVAPSYVDNVTFLEQGQESEMRSEFVAEYGLNLAGNWGGRYSQLDLDYDATAVQYRNDAQSNYSFWVGNSALQLGGNGRPYGLEATHSRQRIVSNPRVTPLLNANTVEREIVGIAPTVGMRFSEVDVVRLGYRFDNISIQQSGDLSTAEEDIAPPNDSKRHSISLGYLHLFSATQMLSLNFVDSRIKYELGDATGDETGIGEYDSQQASISYSGMRDNLAYTVAYGVSKISVGDDFNIYRPSTNIELNYVRGDNTFQAFYRREMTDTSFGNGNDDFFSADVGFDGSRGDQDLVQRRATGLNWQTAALCARCTVDLGAGVDSQEFLNNAGNDTEQTFVRANFGYRIGPRSDIGFAYTRNDNTSEAEPTEAEPELIPSFYNEIIVVRWNYRVTPRLDINLDLEKNRRRVEGDAPIIVNTYAAGLMYRF